MEEINQLLQKLELELETFKDYVRDNGIEFAIDRAYEITVKQEILDSIIYDRTLSSDEIKALLKCDNVIDQCYDEWLKSDGNLKDTLNFVVDDRLDFIIDDYSKKDKNEFDYTLSEEDEKAPVGFLKFNSNEILVYTSEKELLDSYKDVVNTRGINAVEIHINKSKDKPRHGLSFLVTKEQFNQYGEDYTKEQYEKNYRKAQVKKKNKDAR